MTEIHIDWDGPFQADELSNDRKKDYGIYQFYGYHPVYGADTLLYIGKAQEGTFSSRMGYGDHTARHDKYWTSDSVSIYLGRLTGAETPSAKTWSEEIMLAEKLLIYAHSPAWNSQELNLVIDENDDLFNIHVFNWGRHKRLLPEVSGRRYTINYPKDEDYKIYSL